MKKEFVTAGLVASVVLMGASSVFAQSTSTVMAPKPMMTDHVAPSSGMGAGKATMNDLSMTRGMSTTAMSTSTAAKIACVGAAVAVRESTIGTSATAYGQAMSSAYSARSSSLAQAYTQTTTSAVHSAVKSAWATFESSMKAGTKSWQLTRRTAWTTFRTAANACKAPSTLSDSMNSSSEVSGN